MSEEEIDLKEIFGVFWKNKVFITSVTLVFIIIGFIFSIFVKTPIYTAHSYITFGRIEGYVPREGESQLLSEIQFNTNILGNYINFMLSNDVLNQVMKNLKLEDAKLGDFKEQIELEVSSATIEITATADSEELAENIANELLNVFTEKSKEFYRIEHSYTISNADDSTTESSANHVMDIISFAIIGIALSMGTVLAKYLLNPQVVSEKNIEEKLKLPYIASIENKKDKKIKYIDNSEQFDVLRANLEFSINNLENQKTIFITSINNGEGKSFVSINLASAFAKIGKKVLIIDTDKNGGILDKVFEVENNYGLFNYLVDSNTLSGKDNKIEKQFIKSTKTENLDVITLGKINDKQLNIMLNETFIKFFNEIKERYDVIILDGAEILQYADSRFLTNISDGTILVAQKNKTKQSDLVKAAKEIQKVNGKLLGVVLNEIK